MTDPLSTQSDPRSVPILARSLYRELRSRGFVPRDVISLAGELVGMVATDVRSGSDDEEEE